MKYTETEISLAPEADTETTADLLGYLLGQVGYESFVTEGQLLKAYIPTSKYSEEELRQALTHSLVTDKVLGYKSSEQPDVNWNTEWEKNYYQPVVVNDGRLAIRASFHEPVPGTELELIIDPKMAFGTGNHATTLGMLQLILDEELEGKSIIDMGCGSGILGILAMKLGAKHCLSIDIDEWSVENTKANEKVNGVSLEVHQGDAGLLSSSSTADLLLANINRNIILNDLPHYIDTLKPNGTLLLSGFLKSDLPQITDALAVHGFHIARTLTPSGDWVAVKAVPTN